MNQLGSTPMRMPKIRKRGIDLPPSIPFDGRGCRIGIGRCSQMA